MSYIHTIGNHIWNNSERDKFLTEALGMVYHNFHYGDGCWYCGTCNAEGSEDDPYQVYHSNIDFSSWAGFGILKDFINKREWSEEFWFKFLELDAVPLGHDPKPMDAQIAADNMTPDNLATNLCEYLEARQ